MNETLTNLIAEKWALYLSQHADSYPDLPQLSVSHNNINFLVKRVEENHEIYIVTIVEAADVETLWAVLNKDTKEFININE